MNEQRALPVSDRHLQWLVAIGVIVITGVLLNLLQPILMPFLVGMALAYLWDPAVDRLEQLGMGRTTGVCLVFAVSLLLLVLMILVLVPLLGRQMHVLAAKVPLLVEWLRTSVVPWLQVQFNIGEGDIPLDELRKTLIENWRSAGGVLTRMLATATASSFAVLGGLANLVLIPVVGFYLLRDWDRLVQSVREVLPRNWEGKIVELAQECDEVVSAFLRGQLLVMMALAVCYTAGLLIVGLDLALLIGVIAGLASIVPYLGLVIGMGMALAAALFQFGDWLPLLYVTIVFVLSQMLEGMYLTPKLVGDRIGLHPVVVIFAVMAGGQLFGFTGVLLALPIAAVIMVLLRHMHAEYRMSRLYGNEAGAQANEGALPLEPLAEPDNEEQDGQGTR